MKTFSAERLVVLQRDLQWMAVQYKSLLMKVMSNRGIYSTVEKSDQ